MASSMASSMAASQRVSEVTVWFAAGILAVAYGPTAQGCSTTCCGHLAQSDVHFSCTLPAVDLADFWQSHHHLY